MTTKAKAKAFDIADFFTLPGAQAGKPLPLKMPDGSKTDYHLTVMGADAPEARQALLNATRALRDGSTDEMSEDEKFAITEKATLQFRADLVAGWNLPVEFTREAVIELLTNNPGLAQEIEQFSGDRSRFFGSVLTA